MDFYERTPYPFKVHHTENLVSAEDPGELYKGYTITMRVDPRDARGDPAHFDNAGAVIRPRIRPFPFKAYIYRDNAILVVAPLVDFADRGNDDEVIRDKYQNNNFVDALDNTRGSYIRRQGENGYQSKARHYVLEFKSEVELSSEAIEINRAKKDNILNPQAIAYDVELDDYNRAPLQMLTVPDPAPGAVQGTTIQASKWTMYPVLRLAWCVADMKLGSKLRGASTFRDDDDGEIAGLFGGVNIG